jgi:hypothetical protein
VTLRPESFFKTPKRRRCTCTTTEPFEEAEANLSRFIEDVHR